MGEKRKKRNLLCAKNAPLLLYGKLQPAFAVFVILDLDDSVGIEIASYYESNCAEKRDAIKSTGAYPAFTLALTLNDANALLGHGWPNERKIGKIPVGMIPVILISEGRCLVVLIRR